jgi:hypothetical protein
VKLNTEGTNMEFQIEAGVGVELEESVGTSTAGITEIITVTWPNTFPEPTSTVKANGMSDTSSNSKRFNLTSNKRQHRVSTSIRERSISTRDIGTDEGETVAQNTL